MPARDSRGRFVKAPGFEDKLARSGDMRGALAEIGRGLARAAEARGQRVARSYAAEVVEDGDAIQVHGTTDKINAAGWIEYGTSTLPAAAPMRGGAADEGLTVRS